MQSFKSYPIEHCFEKKIWPALRSEMDELSEEKIRDTSINGPSEKIADHFAVTIPVFDVKSISYEQSPYREDTTTNHVVVEIPFTG